MDLPKFLRERLIDLERSHSGPIPAHRRSDAMMPRAGDTPEQIAEAIAYFTWQAKSEWLKCDGMQMNAGHPSMSEWERRTGSDRLEKQQNRWRAAVNKRDAWVAAKHRMMEAAE